MFPLMFRRCFGSCEKCALVPRCRPLKRPDEIGCEASLAGAPPLHEGDRRNMPSEAIQCKPLEVSVGDKGIERAIKHLKRKMAAEGILRELKRRRHYMKP